MEQIKRVRICLTSIIYWFSYKILYHNRMKMKIINSIKGYFRVELMKGSCVKIGNFLMSRGPLYIKCTENASLTIGNKVFFNHNCSITCAESICIGSNCIFANNLVIVDHDHKIDKNGIGGSLVSQPVIIGDNVWIGANVTITKGVHIGEGAVIGANSVVTKDIKSHTIAFGVPAKENIRIVN